MFHLQVAASSLEEEVAMLRAEVLADGGGAAWDGLLAIHPHTPLQVKEQHKMTEEWTDQHARAVYPCLAFAEIHTTFT